MRTDCWQTFKPHEPSDFTSFRTDLQLAHFPSEVEVLQRSETQTSPTVAEPAGQLGGTTHQPAERLNLELGQVVH